MKHTMPWGRLLAVVIALYALWPGGMGGWTEDAATSEAFSASARSGDIQPDSDPDQVAKQGNVVIVRLSADNLPGNNAEYGIRLGGLKGKLFQQGNSGYEGILGIPVDMAPGKYTLQVVQPETGKVVATKPFQVVDGRFSRQNITVSKTTKGLEPLPGEMEAIQGLKTAMTPVRYWQRPFISPTPDCENSPFGVKRYHNGVYTKDYHKGVDLRSPQGRSVRAITDGTVRIAAPHFRLHGGTVGLDHGQGIGSVYIHLSKVLVKPGQVVKKGDVIGQVGSTGFATGPHLHWGLYANGVPVNPDQWIPVPRC